jgi:hypothetical protein
MISALLRFTKSLANHLRRKSVGYCGKKSQSTKIGFIRKFRDCCVTIVHVR